ncbi:MAG: hypothetical protein ACLFUH_10885 [Bacteroidales bacterium]
MSGLVESACSTVKQAAGKTKDFLTRKAKGATVFHRLADNFQGLVFLGMTMVFGGVMMVKATDPEVINNTVVETIRESILGNFETAASLVVVLVLALIFGYAMRYLDIMNTGKGMKKKGA